MIVHEGVLGTFLCEMGYPRTFYMWDMYCRIGRGVIGTIISVLLDSMDP